LDGSMVVSYWLVIFAVVLRLVALAPTAAMQDLLHASATAWSLALSLYLWRSVPMLIRPPLLDTLSTAITPCACLCMWANSPIVFARFPRLPAPTIFQSPI